MELWSGIGIRRRPIGRDYAAAKDAAYAPAGRRNDKTESIEQSAWSIE